MSLVVRVFLQIWNLHTLSINRYSHQWPVGGGGGISPVRLFFKLGQGQVLIFLSTKKDGAKTRLPSKQWVISKDLTRGMISPSKPIAQR